MQLKSIARQVVAVVGASSGIGRSAALKFARQGAELVVAARSQTGLDSLVTEIHSFGGKVVAIAADVTEFDRVKAIADLAVSTYGRLDTWVHVAGTGLFSRFEDISPEEFKRAIEVNLLGQVYGAMAALPHLRQEGRGALIHISSVEARRSIPLQSPYSASKHGVEGFLESLRVELMHEKIPISVTNLMPSVINTPFYNKALTKLGVKPMTYPPFYQPELVADAILYVAEHPTRDYIVGDVGIILDLVQKVSPALIDRVLAATYNLAQHTDESKTESDPNNLFEPVDQTEGYDRIRGDYSNLAIPSLSDWINQNSVVKWGLIGLGVLGVAALVSMGVTAAQFKNGTKI
jgi:NAD(P)-dependent dehydrogenase (short-subunit alcohol dehydrogenase family)